MDPVFKALADPHRRQLLDRLHERDGQTLWELQSYLPASSQRTRSVTGGADIPTRRANSVLGSRGSRPCSVSKRRLTSSSNSLAGSRRRARAMTGNFGG